MPPSLERQYRLDIQVPAVPVQGRHDGDSHLPRDPPPLPIPHAVQDVHIAPVLHALADACQEPP